MFADADPEAEDPVNAFRRRSRLGPPIKLKKKHQAPKPTARPPSLSEHSEDDLLPSRPAPKKRRISSEDTHDTSLLSDSSSHLPSTSRNPSRYESLTRPRDPRLDSELSTRISATELAANARKKSRRDTKGKLKRSPGMAIELDASDDALPPEPQSTPSPPLPEVPEVHARIARCAGPISDSESDEEFAEIAARARAKAKAAREAQTQMQSQPVLQRLESSGVVASQRDVFSPLSPTPATQARGFQPQSPRSPGLAPEEEHVVDLLITTKIPGANPLKVRFNIGLPLRKARLAWCQRQGFDKKMANSVCFRFRGIRTWDTSTCISLGFLYDEGLGKVVYKREPGGEWGDPVVVDLEAESSLVESARAEEKEVVEIGEEEEEEEKVEEIRLVLKGQGRDDVRVKLQPVERISKLIEAVRKRYGMDSREGISLWIDGEQLRPEARITETDLEDMDAIEVHVR